MNLKQKGMTVRYPRSSEVHNSVLTHSVTKKPHSSSIFLLSDNVQNYWSYTTMIFDACRTSLEMFHVAKPFFPKSCEKNWFCVAKPFFFPQLLKPHVLSFCWSPLWIFIFLSKEKVPSAKNQHFGVLDSVRQRQGYFSIILGNFHVSDALAYGGFHANRMLRGAEWWNEIKIGPKQADLTVFASDSRVRPLLSHPLDTPVRFMIKFLVGLYQIVQVYMLS